MKVKNISDTKDRSLLPRPCPDQEFYESTMESGFKLFPERKDNYVKWQMASKGEILDYLPVMLDIENVSRCNYHCTMCQVSDWVGHKRADDMSFDDYKKLINSQYGLVEIKLQGAGEPLMGKRYSEMIMYARSRHLWVRSTTNGSLLHINDNYKRVIDSDICELQVSVDGVTEKTYEQIRRGGRFKTVTENCIKLNQYCRDVRKLRSRMWVVVQRANFNELEKFPEFASALGFKRLSMSLDLNDFGQDKRKAFNDSIDMHDRFTKERALQLIELGEKEGVEVTFWFIDEKFDTSDREKLCPWPFQRAYVSSDMRVVPCCMISNPDVLDFGDANAFCNVWNNSKMIAFRRMHINGNVPHICKSCYK